MAKSEIPVTEGFTVVEPVAERQLIFSDQVFTSRTLIIPGSERTLSVAKSVVQVLASDSQAVNFLKANAEFQLQKE